MSLHDRPPCSRTSLCRKVKLRRLKSTDECDRRPAILNPVFLQEDRARGNNETWSGEDLNTIR